MRDKHTKSGAPGGRKTTSPTFFSFPVRPCPGIPPCAVQDIEGETSSCKGLQGRDMASKMGDVHEETTKEAGMTQHGSQYQTQSHISEGVDKVEQICKMRNDQNTKIPNLVSKMDISKLNENERGKC